MAYFLVKAEEILGLDSEVVVKIFVFFSGVDFVLFELQQPSLYFLQHTALFYLLHFLLNLLQSLKYNSMNFESTFIKYSLLIELTYFLILNNFNFKPVPPIDSKYLQISLIFNLFFNLVLVLFFIFWKLLFAPQSLEEFSAINNHIIKNIPSIVRQQIVQI